MPVRFHEELLGESLDEAAALYTQRCQDLDPPTVGLHHVLDVDVRIEAHLDLLCAGGDDALTGVAATAAESAGGGYTGARALLRQGQVAAWSDLTETVLATPDDPDRLANGEPPRLAALKAASAHEAWVGDLQEAQRLLSTGGDSPLTTCLAYAAGYQRWDAAAALQAGLKAGVAEPATWLWALGQIGEAQARDTLLPFLEEADAEICRAAALALCRTEEDQMAAWLVAQALNQLWAPIVLAFLGGPRALPVLSKHIETGDVFAVTAAGLLGDGGGVDVLLAALANPEQATASAQALHLLTGLAPQEQRQRTPPVADPDEPPFVDTDEPAWQLAVSQQVWSQALQRAPLKLSPGIRYRLGHPADPAQSLLALRSPHVRQSLRTLLIDELFIRFGLGVHLRADQHAGRQLRVLDKLEQFLPHMVVKPVPGHFTFQGRRGVGA
ncbi:MAG: hypothetical protein SF187_01255 [Deltaproteobacteria bacterium]|nr:hypothetical protein [Deltaproteobacteria bacterium]